MASHNGTFAINDIQTNKNYNRRTALGAPVFLPLTVQRCNYVSVILCVCIRRILGGNCIVNLLVLISASFGAS